MHGWIGKILRVNLSAGTSIVEDLDEKTARDFIGGRGLATKYLLDEIDPTIEALSPDNKFIFATGPLTGTGAPTSRYMVVTKSPLTGTVACSNSGGHFGPEMKYAGYDMIIIEGKADKPVYVWVYNDQVEIRSAEELWGKTTHEAEDIIHRETDPDAKISGIGPAGENLVRFACVINDKHRGAGRSGVGAVLGSKNLKAVAVRGTGGVTVADKEAFRDAALDTHKKVLEAPMKETLNTYGTAALVNVINETGMLPSDNYQQGQFAGASKISGETLRDTLFIREKGCFGCNIACGRVSEVTNPKYKGHGEGPEYENIWALGSDVGVDNLEALTKANFLCNELGMDPISAGATIACAMELSEKDYLPLSDSEKPLRFGDHDLLIELLEKAAYREGFGDILAEGSDRVARKYGHPELFMGVKGQEFPAYDGRGAQGIGLAYATANRGACHLRAYTIAVEVLGSPELIDRTVTDQKAFWTIAFQNTTAAWDSTGICLFTSFMIGLEELSVLLNTATGLDTTAESLLQMGERIWNLEKIFNLRAGITGADDKLPERITGEGIPEGPSKGMVNKLGEMLPEYYQLRGWAADSRPTTEKLSELGLQEYIKGI